MRLASRLDGWARVRLVVVVAYWLIAIIATFSFWGEQQQLYYRVFMGEDWWRLDSALPETQRLRESASESARSSALVRLLSWALGFLMLWGLYAVAAWVSRGFSRTPDPSDPTP